MNAVYLLATLWTLLLVTSGNVNAAATKQPKAPEAASPPQDVQQAKVSETTPTASGQSQSNWTKAASTASKDTSSPARTKKNEPQWQYNIDRPEEYRRFSGVRYTPLDLAEYILRTRDEEGVALAIEELLREGLINREEAILYLESVKKELQTLKKRFDDANSQNFKSTAPPRRVPQLRMQSHPAYEAQRKAVQADDKRSLVQHEQQVPPQLAAFHKQMQQTISLTEPRQQVQATKPDNIHEQMAKQQQQQLPLQLAKLIQAKADQEKLRQPNRTSLKSVQLSGKMSSKSNNNNNMTQAAVADTEHQKEDGKPAYDDYLMENVIYQLAKDMFTQSMIKDNASAEQLLSRFATFLESELADKRFSKETQNKIMDTVSAALVESLRERLYLEN